MVTKEEINDIVKNALELFKRQELQVIKPEDWNGFLPISRQKWTDKHDICLEEIGNLRKEMKEKLKELEWRIRALEEEDAS